MINYSLGASCCNVKCRWKHHSFYAEFLSKHQGSSTTLKHLGQITSSSLCVKGHITVLFYLPHFLWDHFLSLDSAVTISSMKFKTKQHLTSVTVYCAHFSFSALSLLCGHWMTSLQEAAQLTWCITKYRSYSLVYSINWILKSNMNGTGGNFLLLNGNYVTKGMDIFLYYIVVNNSDNITFLSKYGYSFKTLKLFIRNCN